MHHTLITGCMRDALVKQLAGMDSPMLHVDARTMNQGAKNQIDPTSFSLT